MIFKEKIIKLREERYQQIAQMLCRIEKVKANRSKNKESYRKGRKTVAKLAIRGKTLNVYLALDPKEFEDTKYNYQDVSDKKSYATCPMRLKMTSDRQVKWAKELITILAEQNGWKLVEDQVVEIVEEQVETAPQVEQQIEVVETTEQEQPAEQIAETVEEQTEITETAEETESVEQIETNSPAFASFGTSKTFSEKLEGANETLAGRYQQIAQMLGRIEKIKANRSKNKESYRKGRKTVAKLAIRGKTLNVYLALDPKEFEDTKYNYKDVSDKKSYATCPMRLKMTSDRQVKWAKELITILAQQNGWKLVDDQVVEIIEQTVEPQIEVETVEQVETIEEVIEQVEQPAEIEQQYEVAETVETVEETEIVEETIEEQVEQPAEVAQVVEEQTETVEQAETVEMVEQPTQSQIDEVVEQPKKSKSKKGRTIKRKFD